MHTSDPAGRRVSPFRVMLLVLLGGTVCVGFTAPGKWVAAQAFRPWMTQPVRGSMHWIGNAEPQDSRLRETLSAFRDMNNDCQPAEGTRAVPTPTQVAARLTGIDGWTTAVMFEPTASPSDLYAAGLEDHEACVILASSCWPVGPGYRVPAPSREPSGPTRSWRIVLLNDQRRRVADVFVNAVRAGFTEREPNAHEAAYGWRAFIDDPASPGDGELPAVCVFHRDADGRVTTG